MVFPEAPILLQSRPDQICQCELLMEGKGKNIMFFVLYILGQDLALIASLKKLSHCKVVTAYNST